MARGKAKRAASPPPAASQPEPKKQAKKGKSAAAEPITDEDQSTPEVVADAQVASVSGLAVPIDENCPFNSYRVYIDPTTKIIYDASLNQTNASNNNNKFYRCQVRAYHVIAPFVD